MVMTQAQQDTLAGIVHLRKYMAKVMDDRGLPIGVGLTDPYMTPHGIEIELQAIFPILTIGQSFPFGPDCQKTRMGKDEYVNQTLTSASMKLREMADLLDNVKKEINHVGQ